MLELRSHYSVHPDMINTSKYVRITIIHLNNIILEYEHPSINPTFFCFHIKSLSLCPQRSILGKNSKKWFCSTDAYWYSYLEKYIYCKTDNGRTKVEMRCYIECWLQSAWYSDSQHNSELQNIKYAQRWGLCNANIIIEMTYDISNSQKDY